MANYWTNQPRGRFFENCKKKCEIHQIQILSDQSCCQQLNNFTHSEIQTVFSLNSYFKALKVKPCPGILTKFVLLIWPNWVTTSLIRFRYLIIKLIQHAIVIFMSIPIAPVHFFSLSGKILTVGNILLYKLSPWLNIKYTNFFSS